MELRRGAHLPFPGHWATESWRMASATPDLRLPSQPQSLTAQWPVPIYTAWWTEALCVNNFARLEPATSRLRQVRRPNQYTPPRNKLGIMILEILWFVDWKVKGQGNGVNKCIFHSMTITPMLTDNSNTAWVWTLSAFYRVAQKTGPMGHTISLQIFW